MKKCAMCQKMKRRSSFGFRTQAKDKKNPYCKKCWAKRANETYHKDPSYMDKYNAKYRRENRRAIEDKRM